MTKGAGLTGNTASVDGAVDVVDLIGVRETQRLTEDHAVGRGGEVLRDRTTVDSDGAGSGTEADTCDCTLAATGRLSKWLRHVGSSVTAAQRALAWVNSMGSGFCAACGCTGPA